MINFQIRKMRDETVQLINQYDVPLEVKRLVLAEILSEVSNLTLSQITKEMEEINRNAEPIPAIVEDKEDNEDAVQQNAVD